MNTGHIAIKKRHITLEKELTQNNIYLLFLAAVNSSKEANATSAAKTKDDKPVYKILGIHKTANFNKK